MLKQLLAGCEVIVLNKPCRVATIMGILANPRGGCSTSEILDPTPKGAGPKISLALYCKALSDLLVRLMVVPLVATPLTKVPHRALQYTGESVLRILA